MIARPIEFVAVHCISTWNANPPRGTPGLSIPQEVFHSARPETRIFGVVKILGLAKLANNNKWYYWKLDTS